MIPPTAKISMIPACKWTTYCFQIQFAMLSYASSTMTTQVHREPTDQQGHGTVAATCDKKQRAVLYAMMVVDVKEGAKPVHGDEHQYNGEDERLRSLSGGQRPWPMAR